MFAECSTNFLTRLVFSSPLSTGRTHLLSVTRETKFIPHEQCVKHALYHLVSFFFPSLSRSLLHSISISIFRSNVFFFPSPSSINHTFNSREYLWLFFFLHTEIFWNESKSWKKLKDIASLVTRQLTRLTRFCYSKFSSKIESIESSYPLGKKGTDRKGASGYIDSQLGYRATFISVFRVYMYIHIYLLWPFQLFIWSSWWLKQNERQTYTTGGNWYP